MHPARQPVAVGEDRGDLPPGFLRAGDLDPIVDALITAERAEQLAADA